MVIHQKKGSSFVIGEDVSITTDLVSETKLRISVSSPKEKKVVRVRGKLNAADNEKSR